MPSRIIYSSHCLCSVDEAKQLCVDARSANAASQVTGGLYLADQTFFQYLEGDELRLSALYRRVQKDARHTNCRLLDSRLITLRIFKSWSMTWLPCTTDTHHLLQAIVPRGSNPATMDGGTAGTLFMALSQSAQHA